MTKCCKCGKEIPNTGEDNPNWKLYCKNCMPDLKSLLKVINKKKSPENIGGK